MPGIFGIVDALPARSECERRGLVTLVEQMAAAMQYEASYSRDLVCRPELGACVGRVGFSHGRARAGEGPSGLAVMTTGEPAYDAGEQGGGHHEITAIGAGARDLIRAYQRSGADGVVKAAGAFAGFLADGHLGQCLLFNDRYGMQRLFLHTDGSRTFFSSEAKAILAVAPRTRAFDPAGLAELLACGCTLGIRSIFRHIEVVEGGTVLTFRAGAAPVRQRYFRRADLEQTTPVAGAEFMEGFSGSLRSAVNDAFGRAPRVGISLTGGLDSRMVMASLDAPAGSVPCYTFGSMYRTTFDVAVGRQVAAQCGQPHQVIELGGGFLSSVRESVEQSVYVSDGYMGLSGAAELYLNRQVRSIAPGRMTGNWGGELMRGVRAFKHVVPRGDFLRPEVVRQVRESAGAFTGSTDASPLSFALFHQMPFQGYGRHAIERSQVIMRSPFLANDVVSWLYKAPAAVRESGDCSATVIGRRPGLLAIPTDTGRLGTGAAAVKFARRAYRRALVKAEYLTSHGAPNWLAAMAASLPSGLLETRFLGLDKFQHFRLWMRNELSGFVRETLLDERDGELGEWFDMRRVGAMVDDHIAGRANYTDEIDKVLAVAVARKTLFRRFDQGPRR